MNAPALPPLRTYYVATSDRRVDIQHNSKGPTKVVQALVRAGTLRPNDRVRVLRDDRSTGRTAQAKFFFVAGQGVLLEIRASAYYSASAVLRVGRDL